jgi:Ca-activated chloride channel family protein
VIVWLPVFAASALAAPVVSSQTPSQRAVSEQSDSYQFRVNVNLVSFSVTVLDDKRRLVTGLSPSNFTIYEDGVPQSITVFSHEEVPLRMMVLLDTSSSMQMKLGLAQEAAVNFVRSLKPIDQLEVVEFNDRVRTISPLGSDFEAAIAAIQDTEAEGATSLFNAIYVSLKKLVEPRADVARQALVVLTDGADTRSLVSFDDVLALARKSNVLIYAISLRATKKDLEKDKYREARYALGKLTDETGGVTFAPESIRDLTGIYERIGAELRSQYSIGYSSTNAKTDGSWRRVQVQCDLVGSQVRTRHGYFAPRVARSERAAPR